MDVKCAPVSSLIRYASPDGQPDAYWVCVRLKGNHLQYLHVFSEEFKPFQDAPIPFVLKYGLDV
jgi:hypothetical protein